MKLIRVEKTTVTTQKYPSHLSSLCGVGFDHIQFTSREFHELAGMSKDDLHHHIGQLATRARPSNDKFDVTVTRIERQKILIKLTSNGWQYHALQLDNTEQLLALQEKIEGFM